MRYADAVGENSGGPGLWKKGQRAVDFQTDGIVALPLTGAAATNTSRPGH